MFARSILVNQARQFSSKVAGFAPQVTKTLAKGPKAAATPAKAAPKTPAKAAAPKATKASPVAASKATKTSAAAPKTPKTPKAPKDAAQKAPKAPKASKEAVPAKEVKIPAEFRPKMRDPIADAPLNENAKVLLERHSKLHQHQNAVLERMRKLVQKKDFSPELLAKYKAQTDKIDARLMRALLMFRKHQTRALKEQRLHKMPSAEKLNAMSPKDRLVTILGVDHGLKTGYQLFARELKSTNKATSGGFTAYLNGWKSLSEAEQTQYNKLVEAAKAKRAAASV